VVVIVGEALFELGGGRQLEIVEAAEGPAVAHQLGLEEPDERLGKGVVIAVVAAAHIPGAVQGVHGCAARAVSVRWPI
jgi:hypothetical protein